MTPDRLPELLDRVSTSAPYVDPAAIARTARAAATANRRRRMIVVPVAGFALVLAASAGMRNLRNEPLEPAAPTASVSPKETTNTAKAMSTQYICCKQADMEQVIHPGGVLALRLWAVRHPSATSTGGSRVLTASIKGPYKDINALKSDGGTNEPSPDLPTYEADPIVVTDASADEVISLIHVPPTAGPGFYNLRFEMKDPDSGGGSGGASIVRITAN